MKKNNIFASAMFCIFFIAGCSLQPPKSVSLKTKAKYNFSIGEISKDFSDMFSMEEILTQEDDSTFKVYDYRPSGDSSKIRNLLMEIPIFQIPIDFSSSFENTDISANLENMSFSQKISVPDLQKEPITKEIDISQINDAINESFSLYGIDNEELDLSFISETTIFDSISYSSGYIEIRTVETDFGFGEYLGQELSGEIFLKNQDEIVSSAEFENGIAKLPLQNVTLYKENMSIEFTEGTGLIAWEGFINGQIHSAKGISLTPTIINVDENLEMNFEDASFDSCVIGEGFANVDFLFPSSWKNIYTEYGLELSGTIDAHAEKTSFAKNISLNDKVLSKENLNVKSDFEFSIVNGDIYFEEKPQLVASIQIDKIANVSITIEDEITTSFDITESLPEETTNVLREICLVQSGLKGTYTNTLPEGNYITLMANSSFLNINDSKPLEGGKENEVINLLSSNEENIQKIDSSTQIDFSANILLPGCSSPEEKTITVVNVEPGKEYELSLEVEPIIDWKSAKIDASSFSQKDRISTGADISALTSTFDDLFGEDSKGKIALPKMNTYLFLSKPDCEIFDDIKLTGEIFAFNGIQQGEEVEQLGKEIYLLEKDTSLNFINKPSLQKEENIVTTNINNLEYSLGPIDLSKIFDSDDSKNNEDAVLFIDYDLSFSDVNSTENEIVIKKSDLENTESTSVEIIAMVVVPLNLEITDDLEINLMELSEEDSSQEEESSNGDLLGREEEPEFDEEMTNIISLVKSCNLEIKDTQLPIICDNLKLLIDFNPNDDIEEKELSLKNGTLSLNPEEILNIYPLVPEVRIKIPKGESIGIAQELLLKTKLNFSLETDGEIALWGGNKE